MFKRLQINVLIFIFCILAGFGIKVNAQPLPGEPAGGWEDDAEEVPVPNAAYGTLPSSLNIYPLNNYYDTWDTLYVRRNVLPFTLSTDTIALSFDTSTFVFPVKGQLLSPFGYRGRRVHAGIDVKLNRGDTIVSAFDGIVRIARYNSGYGNCIVIRHYNGLETLYGHLSKMLVTVNQPVKAGELIGLGGRTGRATCDHLHFETRFCGQAFNPRQIIDLENFALVADTFRVTRNTFGYRRDYMPGTTGCDLASSANKSPGANTAAKYYTIRSGDTLGSIAQRQRTTVSKLCAINGIRQSKILKPGTRIRVR